MQTVQNSPDIASPKIYIGLDVHKKSWSVTIRTDIAEHKTYTMPPEPNQLVDYITKTFGKVDVSLAYESGCCGFTAAHYFLMVGWNTLVVNPADIPSMNKQLHKKTDTIDSKNLVKQLMLGQLKGIYIPDQEQCECKALVRRRWSLAKQIRLTKNQLKGFLLLHHKVIPLEYDNNNWSKAFIEWMRNIKWEHSIGKTAFDSLLNQYEYMYKEKLNLDNQLRLYFRTHHKEDYYLLSSIPGIGGYLAAVILAELGDLRRFDREDELASYIGVIPSIRQSGGKEYAKGITPRAHFILRPYLIESAWVAIRKDPEVQAYYRSHMDKNVKSAIVKVAHKMVKRMLSVIKRGTPYVINTNKKMEVISLPSEIEEIISEAEIEAQEEINDISA